MKFNKFLCLTLVLLIIKPDRLACSETGLLVANRAELSMNTNLMKIRHKHKLRLLNNTSSEQIKKIDNDATSNKLSVGSDIPDRPTYFQAWLKYLKFKESETSHTNKPSQFFKNELFHAQKPNSNVFTPESIVSSKGSSESIIIPSELHFFAVLYQNYLNIFSSKDDSFRRVVDSLNIDDIKPIPESDNFIGGVRDFGTFTEGSCFRVLTREPLEPFTMTETNLIPKKGLDRKWVFCLDKEEQKEVLMNILIKLKLKKQHKLGIFLEVDQSGNPKEKIESVSNLGESEFGHGDNPDDGYWVLLQDWSQCTLKCGGGLQYQQLMCIPPKRNGKACQGQPIRSRSCNVQPCPSVTIAKESLNESVTKSINTINSSDTLGANHLPPIVKMMPISSRRNRYDKCKLKEGDALLVKKYETSFTKIPVRIVLNERTFSIYKDDDMKNVINSYIIKSLTFSRVKDDPRCFILTNLAGEKNQLCQLDSNNSEWVEEWDYDFNLFKYQCYSPMTKSQVKLKIEEEKKMEKKFKEEIQEVKLDIVKEIKERLKKKVEESEEIELVKRVEKVKENSYKVLKKEIKLEQLIEQEEEAKEKIETQEMQQKIEYEEKKNECLLRAIKEKEKEDQFNISKKRTEETIKEIEKETKRDISQKRLEIKKKIIEMRKRQGKKFNNVRKEEKGIRRQTNIDKI